MKLSITLSFLLALIVISQGNGNGGTGGGNGNGGTGGGNGNGGTGGGNGNGGTGGGNGNGGTGGGNGKGGTGGGNGKGPSGISNGYKNCHKAKLACKILRNSVIVKVRKCLVPTATCTVNGGSIVGADGATYTFFFCTEVSAIGGGNGYSDKCLGTPPVLPTASDDPVVLQFCDPQWYNMACLVTSIGDVELKSTACPRNGQCTFSSSGFTYKGLPVTAKFCINCTAITKRRRKRDALQQNRREKRDCPLPVNGQKWTNQQWREFLACHK